jgi:PPIC-type PPIASE domain
VDQFKDDPMTRFLPTRIGVSPAFLTFFVAGLILTQSASGAAPKAPPAAAVATRKIIGYAVDPTGRPIADALVLFTRADDLSESPPEPAVIAQSQTQSTGRFELSVSAADLKTPAAEWPVFAIWVHKAGFAVAHSTVSPEHCERPYPVAMEGDTPVPFRVETPDGLPCATADVTPRVADFLDHYNRLPQAIQERLTTHTTANGRCEVSGFNNRKFTVAIETAAFGMQMLFVSGKRTPFATVRLRPTHKVEGRLILPAGLKADLSRVRITLTTRDEWRRSVLAALGTDLRWYDSFTLQPNADGRYEVAHVPEGVEIAELCPTYDLPFVVDARAGFLGSGMTGGGTTGYPQGWKREIRFGISWDPTLPEILVRLAGSILSSEIVQDEEIWLRRGVRVTRIVRDAETKRPLPGVVVRMTSVPRNPEFKKSVAKVGRLAPIVGLPLTLVIASGDFALAGSIAIASQRMEQFADLCADEQGRIKCCLCPGQTYMTICGVPEHYFPVRPDRRMIDEIPVGIAECKLPPIELVPECRCAGHCEDAAGRPAAGVRIRATVAATGHQSEFGPQWTKADPSGDFHFDGLEPGTSLTLVSVRAGVPLEERTVVVEDRALGGGVDASRSGPRNVTHVLREKHLDHTSLTGRVVGPDHKPIPGAAVVVEVEHSPDPTHFFRATADAAGRVHTPVQYPQGLKYRLAVRSMLKSVAVSPWICPQTSGSQFADVVVDPARLGLDKRIDGGEVLALVDGRPILGSEIFERAYPESLTPDGLSLRILADEIKRGRATERKYRELQLLAIKKFVSDYVRFHMLSQALEAKFDPAEKADFDRRIDTAFEGYLDTLERQLKVAGRDQLKKKLCSLSTSIATFKKDFRYRVLADEYIRRAGAAAESRIDASRLLADYESHLTSYAVPAKVSWQMLEFQFGFAPTHSPSGEQTSQDKTGDYFARADKPQSTDTSTGPTKTESARGELPSEPSYAESLITDETAKKLGAGVDVDNFAEPWSPEFTRAEARHLSEAALGELRRGNAFEQVVKHFTTGAKSDDGGWQPGIRPESLADPKTADALRQLPEGSTSGVIETEYAYRIVKVACRMPAAWRPFEEVAPMIRRHLRQDAEKRAIDDLYQRTRIESPDLDDLSYGQPATCPPKSAPADAFSE